MQSTARFVVDAANVAKLRTIFLKALQTEQEIGGFFSGQNTKRQKTATQEATRVVQLSLDENVILGRAVGKQEQQAGYTLCEVNDDLPYTFHTHPVEYDENGWPINIANLISNEDMIGVVQDHFSNTGYLSNADGVLVFDILCAPIGIFMYTATEKIISRWQACEDEITKENLESHMRMFEKRYKLGSKNVEQEIARLKHLIQHTHDGSNDFWAEEENALMNSEFNKYLGSWYYTNNKQGLFATLFMKKYAFLGYQHWFDNSKYKTEQDRCNATKEDQMQWFTSKEFLAIDWRNEQVMQNYLQDMRNIGFDVQFFNWSCTRVEFVVADPNSMENCNQKTSSDDVIVIE